LENPAFKHGIFPSITVVRKESHWAGEHVPERKRHGSPQQWKKLVVGPTAPRDPTGANLCSLAYRALSALSASWMVVTPTAVLDVAQEAKQSSAPASRTDATTIFN
jgi:hypothetical protein